ncbi:MAG: homoserine O-acetyltransferase [Lentisphaeria bacterium]|nr:homoserine O-acetyltransferase [Lentisphaeria bacterium]
MEKTDKLIVTPQDFKLPESLELDCGKKLDNVVLRYETIGKLNADRSNAILICHALSGDAHVAGFHSVDDKKPGWWDEFVGSKKPIDTDKYFVICSNVIGSCAGSTGPRSINEATGKMYNMDFPVITIRDMVRAQKYLIDELGIDKLLAVVGGSMGGMQAMEWAINYPDRLLSCLPIATTSQLSPQSIAFDWVGREAIKYDPNYNEGNYSSDLPPSNGLSTARMLAHITYLSDESMLKKFGRSLQEKDDYSFNFNRDFAVESYLEHQGQRFVERFDANSYCYITRAMDYFDLAARHGNDLTNAFEYCKNVKFLVVSFSSDWLFPTSQSIEITRALIKNEVEVSFCEIESSYGHDAFLLEIDALGEMVSSFLDNVMQKGEA